MIRLNSARHLRTLGAIVAFSLLLANLAACGGGGGSTSTNTSPIKIGYTVSLTGDFSADGKAIQQGYQLWADTVNAHGGLLGRKVQLVSLDDASNPDQVTTDYQKLITVDKVDLTFGPFSTLLTKPASVVAHRYGYALPEGAGGGPSVFQQGLNNVFDVSLPVANNLVSFAQWILSLPAAQRPQTAAYATEDDPFTQPQVDLARQMLEQGGVHTSYYKVYAAETTDFTPIAQGVIASGAQVCVFGTLLPDVTAFIQAFKQQHFNPQALIATAGPDQGSQFLTNVGGAQTAEGIFVPNGWYPELNAPGNQAMVNAYIAKYGGTAADVSSDVPEAYSVGQVVQQAVTQNNSLDNAKLIQTLHSATFDSVQGKVKFDATGQNTMATAYQFQWQSGKLIPVFPSSVAAAPPEFPKPKWP
ncbi:MAG TPA: amino acid ABC transporter substrate-binding protein [Ktedonobacterales bacterium]|nr:amino acid ABC transporter substrate-binding protein [Ktedonobacterales bacterium]